MSNVKNTPIVFRGESRFYKVIGMQDGLFYGLNVTVENRKDLSLHLVFAVIGGPLPDSSPFEARSGAVPFMACDIEQPTEEHPPIMVKGQRLNKYKVLAGASLSASEASKYLDEQIPALSTWLDGIIEQAGLIPTFNDTQEVFQFFLGASGQPQAQYVPLELPVLTSKSGSQDIDYSKYGKGTKAGADAAADAQLHADYEEYVQECEDEGGEPDSFEDWKADNEGDL